MNINTEYTFGKDQGPGCPQPEDQAVFVSLLDISLPWDHLF